MLGIKFVILVILLAGLFSCAAMRDAAVPEEVRANVEGRIAKRYYAIHFARPHASVSQTGPGAMHRGYGVLYVQGDTLRVDFDHPIFAWKGEFLMQDYCQSTTERGETVVRFHILREDGKQGKKRPVSFCLTIRTSSKITVNIDGDEDYVGAFYDKRFY